MVASNSIMANGEHVEIVREGATAIEEWRKEHPDEQLDLSGCDLARLQLDFIDSEIDLRKTNFAGSILQGARFFGVNLHDCDFRNADLSDASFSAVFFDGSNLVGANLQDANACECSFVKVQFGSANLSMLVAADADFSGATFGGDMVGAILAHSLLDRCKFYDCELTGADLRRASLSKASFWNCHLPEANFHRAIFDRTEFQLCYFADTILAEVSLQKCRGLETCTHAGPSVVDLPTIFRAIKTRDAKTRQLLAKFLIATGVPQSIIREASAIERRVRYRTAFISFGAPDASIARKLHRGLTSRGVSCWLYDIDATYGARTWKEIGSKRREADKIIVPCSAAALVRDGVLKEIEEQIDDDPDKIIPISLDGLWTEPGFRVFRGARDLKPFLVDRNYADWAHGYRVVVTRLLQALLVAADRA